jgi:flagellar biosynthesis protein FlhB
LPQDKSFEPTSARLARARREGDAPASQAFGVLASLAGAALALAALLAPLAAAARIALAGAARGEPALGPYLVLAVCAFGVPSAALAGAIAAAYLQTGRIVARAPTPKLERLNPFEGLKRMLSRDAALGGARALVVASAVAAAAAPALREAFAAGAGAATAAAQAALVLHAAANMLGASFAVASVFAVADVMLERMKWRRRLRMSFEEIKREYKQNEGDPQLRGRRRRAHRALLRGSLGRLREAAFVICNPSHVAVALAYRPPEIAVPKVVVRAIDAGALEVKRRARALRVPIVEDVALARLLLAASDVDEYIPPRAYAAVAAIVASLLRERSRA